MKVNEKDIELIEKHFDGTLNEEERLLFDKKLSEDIELDELVKLRIALPEIWKDVLKFESTIKEIQVALKENKVPKVFTLKRIYYGVAASILLLVGSFVIFFLVNNNELSDQTADNKSAKEDSLTIMQQMEQPSKARKEIYKAEDNALISPVEGMVFHYQDTIIFKWVNKNDTITHLMVVSLYDNKTVKNISVRPRQEMIIVKARDMKPGEYYWRLSDHKIRRSFTVVK